MIQVLDDGDGLVKASDLVSIRVHKFTDDTADNFRSSVSKAHSTGQPIIPVTISSNGGRIDPLLQMSDAIEQSQIPVLTYTPDRAYSAGFALLAFGTKGYRFVSDTAFTMAHQAKWGAHGKEAEVLNQVEFRKKQMAVFYGLLDQACGQESGFFQQRWQDKRHLDDYLGPEETVEIGAADEVGRPTLTAEANVDWTLNRS